MSKSTTDDPSQVRLLLAMLQHELGTPLSAIVGFAELLRPDMPHAELIDAVARIKTSAAALGEIIDTMPVLSGLDSHDARLEHRPFAPRDLLDELVRSARTEAVGEQIELRVHVDRRIPSRLVGAPGALRQVLTNLLGNALKFTERGRIQIELEQVGAADDEVRLRYSVSDTGPGIRPELRAAIFEPFERGEAAASSMTDGSGLGLSICAKLLWALSSRIELASELGEGSTFSFELSHPRADAEERESDVRVSSPNADQAPRVLIVEDDEDNRALLRRLVQRAGFTVDSAADGRAALSALEHRDYALVFSDIRMSGMDGIELARRIRERESASRKKAPHLVAVTAGRSLMRAEHGAIQERFDTVLLKPLRQRVLLRILAPFMATNSLSSSASDIVAREPVDTAVVSLVPDFLARRHDDLDVLRACLAGRASLKDVARIGHNLRGSALSYGFPRLSVLGGSLEEAAEARDILRIARLLEEMERLVSQARRAATPLSELKRPASESAAVVPIRRN
jgi:CheY-like chemotaxis protein